MAPSAAVQTKRGASSASTREQTIKELIHELKKSCCRPLFEEIVRQEEPTQDLPVSRAPTTADTRNPKRIKRPPTKTWEQLLANAAMLAPSMTLQEFGTVSRIATVLLLGFLVPSSTGNDFFVNAGQSVTQRTAGTSRSESTSNGDAFLDISLEERLEKCCRFYSEGEFGELNSCVDPTREKAFRSFLKNGIGPLLAARPVHPTETDYLHVLAMVVCPRAQHACISKKVRELVEKEASSWLRAKRLMGCIHPRSFHVNYSHRLALVKMMANQLDLPHCVASFEDGPLTDGAIPHMRAALHSFALGRPAAEAHEAHRALVNIAVSTGDETTVNEEWDALVALTANDCAKCMCADIEETKKKSFCPNEARGKLMEQFILRYNESRHFADATFTCRALDSLSKRIKDSIQTSPCVLASLLMAACSLLYFLLPDAANGSGTDERYKEARDTIMRTAIQLLHHPKVCVMRAASLLLALLFSYNPTELTVASIEGVEKSIRMSLDICTGKQHFLSVHDVVVTLSRLSTRFAVDMLDYLLMKIQHDQTNEAVYHLITAVATARPFAAQKHLEAILSLISVATDECKRSQLMATLLEIRQAHLFVKDSRQVVRNAIDRLPSDDISDKWMKYKLARQALVTGNNRIAKSTFETLLASSSSEASFLWMSVLSNVAKSEDELASKGSHGIMSATPLYSAVSYLESLADTTGNCFDFQIEYLQLRIDFLDHCASLYSLCREIRLSGAVPKATVRTGLHLRNTLKLFHALAGRYYSLYRRSGLFRCQQTRTALRTCHAICRWLGDAGHKAFPETLSAKGGESIDDTTWPHGDKLHPSMLLLKNLNKVVLNSMDGSCDPQLRAAAIGETVDAIIMMPYPFPRGFFTIKEVPSSTLRLSIDATVPGDNNDAHLEDDALAIYPGVSCTFTASGEVPSPVIQKAKFPFSHVLLWHANRYVGPIKLDDDVLSDGGSGAQNSQRGLDGSEEATLKGNSGPLASPLSQCGRYFATFQYQAPMEEGVYVVEFTLGCRDIRCGEWQLPLRGNSQKMLVRVSRSQS